MVARPGAATDSRRITVIFLLYNARRMVPALLDAFLRQRHPTFERQADWLEAIVMDDASRDGTPEEVDRVLAEAGRPSNIRFEPNPRNLGLAATVNRAFGLTVTPFGLTCHCDCLFGSDFYVATVLDILERTPDAGAVTAQPALTPGKQLSFAEKVNMAANMMDLVPIGADEELIPVGFAEGRCDGFRLEALRAAGFYDLSFRTAGEDQALAAKMRAKGFSIYQAPQLHYYLSVSDEQDTLVKLIRHARLFGKMHPLLVLAEPGTSGGVVGRGAGTNRRSRVLLRIVQLVSVAAYAGALIALVAGVPAWTSAAALGGIALSKWILFRRHLRAIGFSVAERLKFFCFLPVLDIAYAWGFAQGLFLYATGWARTRGPT